MDKALIVAELSSNHSKKKSIVKDTIKAAKDSGADAFKIQTFDLEHMTLNIRNDQYRNSKGLWKGFYFYDLYKEIQLPWKWHDMIFEECDKLGLICFSAPFDIKSALFLEKIGNPIYKIASSEISHIPLIDFVSKLNKPIVFSTGCAKNEDIELAYNTIKLNNDDITILKSTASYPTALEESNVLAIKHIKKKYEVKVGLSDHTLGHSAAIAAVALGAVYIEKHFILDKTVKSADSSFSMTPKEFTLMVNEIRNIEKVLGNDKINIDDKNSRLHMRSIFTIKEIKKGEVFSNQNIRVMRPNYGLHPKFFNKIIGSISKRNVKKNQPLNIKDFDI
jgi:pseudaminic acid synthase